MFGDYLLVHGSSSSSSFYSGALYSWGNFVLWLHKDLQSDACSSLNPSEDTSLIWSNDPLPMKSINIADVSIDNPTDFMAASVSAAAVS